MAVYQGARQRTVVLPRRPRRGPSRMSVLLATIAVAFAGAFFSLSQDIRVSATGYEVGRLATQQQRLEARASDIRNELNRLGKAPAIRKLAIQSGLGPLPEPAVVPAR